jgi:pSer/pThr/pTyr-binding forkhead associated (FHA) protein
MSLVVCKKCGQYFDSDQNICPYCGNSSIELENVKTELFTDNDEPVSTSTQICDSTMSVDTFSNDFNETTNHNNIDNKNKTTIVVGNKQIEKRLLVGWLVIIEGPGIGEDLKIVVGQNSIGRDGTNLISINFGDNAISRERHAYIIYDPKFHKFIFRNGEGQNLSYVNDEGVYSPIELKYGDIIELGNTKLRFIPFCDNNFNWSEK